MLYSELLSEEELPPQMRSNVEAIRQQSEKLRFLIDSLVKLLPFGKRHPDPFATPTAAPAIAG